jgi:nucleoside 2-deoxyribosyltransferase
MLAYLSGSIEYSPDLGKAWRAELAPFLRSLGHEVYDPALDERKNLSDDEVRSFRSWKQTDLPRFQATLRKIISWDLDWVERSDYVVCLWDRHATRGAGTQGELTYAHRLGRPVYLVLGLPVAEVSGWVLGCATAVFAGFPALREALGALHRSSPSSR